MATSFDQGFTFLIIDALKAKKWVAIKYTNYRGVAEQLTALRGLRISRAAETNLIDDALRERVSDEEIYYA